MRTKASIKIGIGLPMRSWIRTGGGMQLYPWSAATPWYTAQVDTLRARRPIIGRGKRKKKGGRRRFRRRR